ncbi:2-ketoisovalerate ferredoxin reductase [uncultured Clostridium sp.]|nr:2-ketoisovalerate ferredoxin reductase [uncultured Clostridium sp.]
MAKKLMKGNEAIAEAAIQAGCRYFFGYPITPQNEIPEYMSARLPKVGGCFLQAESEVAAINMVYGAAGAGARVMTSSSSPGISLKQEGISYIAGADLPCVIVNMVRGGSGLGSIQPAQSDYFQATRGGGHGDYRTPVLAPASLQEAVELMMDAFDMADKYLTPVMVLGDGMLGQMMEAVDMPEYKAPADLPEKDWAATGWDGKSRKRAVVNSLYINAADLEVQNLKMQQRYDQIVANETRWECDGVEGAEVIVTAYGTMARIVRSAMTRARAEGIKVGMVRPITLWPFPEKAVFDAAAQDSVKNVLCVEMSLGQMVDDVKIAVAGRKPVSFFGRSGGMFPTVNQVLEEIRKLSKGGM